MKRTLLLFLSLILCCSLFGQEMEMQSFTKLEMDMTAKLNPVYDLNNEACALIRVAIATEEATFVGNVVQKPIYKDGEWLVYIPSGTTALKINVKNYLPLNVEFAPVEQFRTYELRVTLPTKNRNRAIILPTFTVAKSQFSYGMMVGFVINKFGGYVRGKTDFNSVKTQLTCDINGRNDRYDLWLTGNSKKSRWAVTTGYVQQVAKPLYLYIGGGYGERTLAWECVDGQYAKVTDLSYKGFEGELGAIIRMGAFAITAGVQTNSFKYLEVNLGLGVMF